MASQGSTGNVIAALCNVFIPGLGQLIQGRLLLAALFFVFITVNYFFWWLIFPAVIGGIAHLICIVIAATYRSDD